MQNKDKFLESLYVKSFEEVLSKSKETTMRLRGESDEDYRKRIFEYIKNKYKRW